MAGIDTLFDAFSKQYLELSLYTNSRFIMPRSFLALLLYFVKIVYCIPFSKDFSKQSNSCFNFETNPSKRFDKN